MIEFCNKYPKVVFGSLDLDLDLNFKLIYLKCLDFKFIDFRSYFKFKHFKSLKFLVDYIDQDSE